MTEKGQIGIFNGFAANDLDDFVTADLSVMTYLKLMKKRFCILEIFQTKIIPLYQNISYLHFLI